MTSTTPFHDESSQIDRAVERIMRGEEAPTELPPDGDVRHRVEGALIARVAAVAPDVALLSRVMQAARHERYLPLLAGIAEALTRDAATRDSWIDALLREAAPHAVRTAMGGHQTRNEARHMASSAEQWARARDPYEACAHRYFSSLRIDLAPLHLLRLLDPVAWCEAIDTLPGPGWFSLAMLFTSRAQAEGIDLIERAPRVFLDDGTWTRSVAAVLLVDQAMDRSKGAEDEAEAEELPTVSPRALCDALLARVDGSPLALGVIARAPEHPVARLLMQKLPARDLSLSVVERLWRDRAYSAEPTRQVGPGARPSPSTLGAAQVGGSGLSLLVAAARVLTSPGNLTDGALAGARERLWALVVESLRLRDRGIPSTRGVGEGDGLPAELLVLAELLALLEDPVASFRALCSSLYDHLDRLAHRSAVDDFDLDAALRSAVLLGALAAGDSEMRDGVTARALYAVAFDLALRVEGARGFDHERSRMLLIVTIGLAAAALRAITAAEVARLLRAVSDRPWDLLSAAALLHRNRVPIEVMRDAFALMGVDPSLAGERFHEVCEAGFVSSGRRAIISDFLSTLPSAALGQPRSRVTERALVASDRRTLIAIGPLERLTRDLGIKQAVAGLRTATPTTSADIRWALELLPEYTDRVDPEVLIVPDLPVQQGTAHPVVRVAPGATDDEIARAVQETLAEHDPFERRQVVRGVQCVGREDVIRRISEDLSSKRIVGLFGLRRVGKTSTALAALDALRDTQTLVYVDVQGIVQRDLPGVAYALAVAMGEALDLPSLAALDPSQGATKALSGVTGALRRVRERRSKIPCIVVDEFDLLFEGALGGPGVDGIERLFDPLVAAVHRGELAMLLIGRDPRRFRKTRGESRDVGPLVGVIREHWLRPLTRDESGELLRGLGRRCGLQINDQNLATAYELAGGHPLLLRLFGRALREEARGGAPAVEAFLAAPDVHELVAGALFVVAQRFPECWSHLAVALLAGEAPALAVAPSTVADPLRRLGMLRDDRAMPSAYVRLGPLVIPVAEVAA